MLKAELHTHIKADPVDGPRIKYSAFDLIDRAAELNFDVLAITCHNYVYQSKEAENYARKKKILLLSGTEADIEKKQVLVYGLTDQEAQRLRTFVDLKRFKEERPEALVIAPHPFFFGPTCLNKKVIEHLDLFDAWEYSFFYCRWINLNQKTVKLAGKYGQPLVGNSDVHHLRDLGKTYTLINSLPDKKAIFQAIKEGKVRLVTRPLSLFEFASIFLRAIFYFPLKKIFRRLS